MADRELLRRIISAAVMIPPVLAAVHFGPPWYTALIVILAAAMVWEWAHLAGRDPAWLVPGTVYMLGAAYLMYLMRGDGQIGRDLIYFLFAVTWTTDTGAYLTGRALGGPKLAPRVSPSKTISGAIGGLVTGGGAGILIWWLTGHSVDVQIAVVAALGSIACQIGDLLESAAKRHFQVKDSGRMIPGHGGILDRVDGLLAAAFAVAAAGAGIWR